MPKKITEEQRRIAKQALIEGKSVIEAGKLAGMSKTTAAECILPEAEIVKKEIRAEFEADTRDRVVKLSKDLLNIAEMGVKAITQEALNKQSGAANSVTIGTVIDKMQLLTGGATENVQISAGPKSDDFLNKLKAKSIKIKSANYDATKQYHGTPEAIITEKDTKVNENIE